MRFKNLSYKAQLFLASLLLVLIPSMIVGIWGIYKNVSVLEQNYNTSQKTIVTQASMTVDTLLADALKISYMPLLNTQLDKAMHTDYADNYLAYAQDSKHFRDQFIQSNRLNQDLVSCIFLNKYGYSFEYNIMSVAQQRQILKNVNVWSELARTAPNYTWFGPLQHSQVNQKTTLLPVIKIVRDGVTFQEIGICYTEINFKSVEKIIASSQNSNNCTYIYSPDNTLLYACEDANPDLSDFLASIPENGEPYTRTLRFNGTTRTATGCINQTTGWHIIQLSDSHAIFAIYRNTLANHLATFCSCLIVGLVLAVVLSRTLTASVTTLCREVDACEANHYEAIRMEACGSNQELRKLVTSFNNLNKRLSTSIEQNYQIRLQAQQTRIQMLQFQINHHFLYNTLNVIRSLANIHGISMIETVALNMSDLLRYSLERFPLASLREELLQVQRYMAIQSIRFPDKFTYDCHIPQQFLDLQVPVMILQPLVENSIEHGFACRENDCCISIICQQEGYNLHILIADNGNGISAKRLEALRQSCSGRFDLSSGSDHEEKHHSIGLKNVVQRIQNYFGTSYGLSIESTEGSGTIIDIVLPVSEKP